MQGHLCVPLPCIVPLSYPPPPVLPRILTNNPTRIFATKHQTWLGADKAKVIEGKGFPPIGSEQHEATVSRSPTFHPFWQDFGSDHAQEGGEGRGKGEEGGQPPVLEGGMPSTARSCTCGMLYCECSRRNSASGSRPASSSKIEEGALRGPKAARVAARGEAKHRLRSKGERWAVDVIASHKAQSRAEAGEGAVEDLDLVPLSRDAGGISPVRGEGDEGGGDEGGLVMSVERRREMRDREAETRRARAQDRTAWRSTKRREIASAMRNSASPLSFLKTAHLDWLGGPMS